MSDFQRFSLDQVLASSSLESKELTEELCILVEKAIEERLTFDEIIPLLIDG